MRSTSASARPILREYRSEHAVWITLPDYEAAGRAIGLPDPAVVERWLAIDGSDSLDTPGRAPTRIVSLPGSDERLHVRRVLHGGWLAPLWGGRVGGLRRTRDELRTTADLFAAGAPVAPAAFAIGRRKGPLWRVALCTLHVEGAVDAITFLRDRPDRATCEAACRAAGAAIRRFHDLGARHADLHLGNILLREDGSGFRAWVIDLDRARVASRIGHRGRARELARLERSLRKRRLVDAIGEAGRGAFLSAYGAC